MLKTKKSGRKKMINETVYLNYLNNLLAGNKKECTLLVQKLLEQKTDVRTIFIKLFQRSMYRIGQLWEKDKCSIADEHIATKITEGLVELALAGAPEVKPAGKTAMITCVDKEFHELGARMVAGMFELNGWKTYFIGSNTPNGEILNIIKDKKPDVVGVSGSFYINIVRITKLIKMIRDKFPDQLIIVGGQAFANGMSEEVVKLKKIKHIENLDALEKFIASHK